MSFGMERVCKLENWYQAEPFSGRTLCLTGKVFNHPEFVGGTLVTTSPLVVYFTNLVGSSSGSRYYLGKPDPEVMPDGVDPFKCRDQFLASSVLKPCVSLQMFNLELERVVRSMLPGGKVTQRPVPRIGLGGTFAGRIRAHVS